ncbi:hypothetical protein M91_01477, partial [Bos mutus]
PSAVVGPACPYCYLWGAQHVTDPACWPDWRAPWLEFPDPCSSTRVPFASHPWMGYPPPAASGPSIWAWGICSFDPLVGSQPSVPCFSRVVLPYPVEPPPPYSSSPPALGGDTPEPGAQWGRQPPPSSARLTAVGRPSRAASHVTMTLEILPSGGVSRFSIWAPKPPCSPELCPLPPSPCVHPQPEPHSPRPHCPPSRAHCRLF